MNVLRKYKLNTAWYAQVELPDGSRAEFKVFSTEEPPDSDFIALAEMYLIMQEPAIEVEAEDGTLV